MHREALTDVAGASAIVACSSTGSVATRCLDPGQQLRFLGRELLVCEHPLLVQLSQPLKSRKDVI